MKTILLSALAIFALSINSNAQAATANTSQTVTLSLQNQIDISVVSGSATGLSFTFSTPATYTSGLTNTSASQFLVKSNKPWAVTIAAATSNFSSTAATAMPANVLGVRLNGGSGSFTALSTTAAAFTSGAKGGSNTFAVDYNANPGFSYDAGDYTLSVVYTATQQ
jgi:hypothetical protein